jgi:hypothetical protein
MWRVFFEGSPKIKYFDKQFSGSRDDVWVNAQALTPCTPLSPPGAPNLELVAGVCLWCLGFHIMVGLCQPCSLLAGLPQDMS